MEGVDARQAPILRSAFEAFLRYGFKRTSMEDIARGAGLSRAALYLHFRNKEDIYQRLIEIFYAQAGAALAVALRREGALEDVLAQAFRSKGGPVMAQIFASPHALEFLGYKAELGGAAMSAGDAQLARVLSDWLEEAAAQGRVALPATASQSADVIMAALAGIHRCARDYDAYIGSLTTLGRMVGRALAP